MYSVGRCVTFVFLTHRTQLFSCIYILHITASCTASVIEVIK